LSWHDIYRRQLAYQGGIRLRLEGKRWGGGGGGGGGGGLKQ